MLLPIERTLTTLGQRHGLVFGKLLKARGFGDRFLIITLTKPIGTPPRFSFCASSKALAWKFDADLRVDSRAFPPSEPSQFRSPRDSGGP